MGKYSPFCRNKAISILITLKTYFIFLQHIFLIEFLIVAFLTKSTKGINTGRQNYVSPSLFNLEIDIKLFAKNYQELILMDFYIS